MATAKRRARGVGAEGKPALTRPEKKYPQLCFFSLFKAIVLLIGTNNHGDSAEEIAEGIKTICTLIRDKQPQAYLVVLVSFVYVVTIDFKSYC